MKATRKKSAKRAIAMVLAAFSMMTASVPFFSATMTASAAVGDDDFDFRGMAIDAVDAGFSDLANLIPGGNFLLSPFKSIFHGAVDKKDPMEIMSDRMNDIDGKLNDIDAQVTALSAQLTSNIKELEAVSDLSELKGYYQDMMPYVEMLKRKVTAIESDKKLTLQEKAVRLGALLQDDAYKKVWANIFKIKNSMANENPNVYGSMFDTLYKKAAANRMFSAEAYNDAKAVADNLSAQYLYSAGLLAECQTAFNAAMNLDEKEVDKLTSSVFTSYNTLKENAIELSSYDNDTLTAVAACVAGYQDFERYNNCNYINMGLENKAWSMDFEDIYHSGQTKYSRSEMEKRQPRSVGRIKDVIAESKKSTFNFGEIKKIADYVKKNHPGTSLVDFFHNIGYDFGRPGGSRSLGIFHAYIVVDGSISEDSKYVNGTGLKYWGSFGYDITKNVSCIDLFDPNCNIQKVNVGSYWINQQVAGPIKISNEGQYDNYNAPDNLFVFFHEA